MNYVVDWLPAAQQQLAQIWTDASDKMAVTTAANAMDRELERDPFSLSESRAGARRIMVIAPLAILFDVDQTQRSVNVRCVWRWC